MPTGSPAADIPITQWLMIIALGGVMGMIGQGVRVIVGLKKLQDGAAQSGRTFRESFETSKLVVSLLIGFIAGALASITIVRNDAIKFEVLLGLLAAGYAGTDFVEGFARKYLPVDAAGAGGAGGQRAANAPPIGNSSPPAIG